MADGDVTVARAVRVEIPRIKGSRFIADLVPVSDAAQADAAVDEARAAFPDARHHCFAWRVGTRGDTFRFGDDGEPAGSAGRPILQHLEGLDVTDAVLVVTRYFGGTKLGVGGLIRAYGGAAAAALDAAELVPVVHTRRVAVEHRYEDSGAVAGFLSALGVEPTSSDYGETIHLEFDVPAADVETFVAELTDRTAGRVRIRIQGDER